MSTAEILTRHARRYPGMAAADYGKLLYQSEFGPSHLVRSDDALERLRSEYARASEEGYAPRYLAEDIGDGLCRFHLDPRRLREEDLPLLARCFALSARPRGSTRGLWRKLGVLAGLAARKKLPVSEADVTEFLTGYDAGGCPPVRHSGGFDTAYTPHYRVLDRDLAVYGPALRAVDRAVRESDGPVIVAVDGRCAAGKTTFAARLAQVAGVECRVFHMDDFFLPPEKRTPERLGAPGGNVDYERAAEELFAPLSRGEAASVRPFRCGSGTYGVVRKVPCPRLSIVEGSYSLHPALAGYSQVHLFLTCDGAVQLSRLARRESPESLERFRERWIPLEEAYFQGFHIQDQCGVVLDTTRLTGRD